MKEGREFFPVNAEGKIQTSDVDYLDIWKGMEECFRRDLARNIRISHFNFEQITILLASAMIKPVNNQVSFKSIFIKRELNF